MKTLLSLLLLSSTLWGGQSLSGGSSYSATVALQARTLPFRMDIQIHDWSSPSGAWFAFQSFGIESNFTGNIFTIFSKWDSDGWQCSQDTTGWTSKRLIVRYQRDTVNGVSGTNYCEIWRDNGDNTMTRMNYFGKPFTTAGSHAFSNVEVYPGLLGSGGGIGFIHVYTNSILALGSKMPTSADTGSAWSWKLDGNLTASTGGANLSRFAGATDTYINPTPGQTVFARITARKTIYSDTTTLNAGRSGETVSCADSATQVDAGGTPTCKWVITAGPSAAALEAIQRGSSGYTSTSLALAGAQFGQYTFQVTATDSAGNSAVATADIGFVAVDAQGIIVHPDGAGTAGAAQQLIGDSLPWGRTPNGRLDERHRTMYDRQVLAAPGWAHPPAGPEWVTKATSGSAISYYPNGMGGPGGPAGTTVAITGINSTDLTINVASVANLELGTFPTWIKVESEIVRLCSAAATVLTVCGGGRGLGSTTSTPVASSHSVGAAVTQLKITGTGTLFKSDATRPQCPAGVPGPSGAVNYSTGTITPTASSAVITGTGTAWTIALAGILPVNDSFANHYVMRMDVKRATVVTPFWAPILSVDSATQITLDRPLPAGTDATAVTYQIVTPRWWAPDFTQTNGRVNPMVLGGLGCESETQGFGESMFDMSGQVSVSSKQTTSSGSGYSYEDHIGHGNGYGPNFYSTGMALRSLHYRSGLTGPKTYADYIDTQWMRTPDLASTGGITLYLGGGIIGGLVKLALDGEANLTWADARKFINRGAGTPDTCNTSDSRDMAYPAWALAIGAKFDPDAPSRTTWLNALNLILTRDQGCVDANGAYPTGLYFNGGAGFSEAVGVTSGSTAVTGTALPSSVCHGTASGTGSATNGSTALTGTGFVDNSGYVHGGGQIRQHGAILVTGTVSGALTTVRMSFTWNSSTSITLGALWPGDTGAITWMESDTLYQTAIATDNNDTSNLAYNYECVWNSGSSLTLHRNWRGSTGTYRIYLGNVAGVGQQPFMLGIKAQAMIQSMALPTLTSAYSTLVVSAGNWITTTGYDANNGGLAYFRLAEACKPITTTAGNYDANSPGCTYGQSDGSKWVSARVLTGEVMAGVSQAYKLAPTAPKLAAGDAMFANLWCDSVFDVGAPVACDGLSPGSSAYVDGSNMSASDLSGAKWPGFFFGIGGGYQWPAARLGGVAAQALTTKSIKARLADHPLAVSMKMTLTWPTGATASATCTSGACAVSWDSRQGTSAILTTEYYDGASGTGKRLALGTQVITGL